MPAYRERLYIIPDENGLPARIVEFPYWWDRQAFFSQYGHRQIDTGNPIYVDFGLLLTGSEAVGWDRQSREQFSHDSRSKTLFYQQATRDLESLLRSANWVVVESYEWESGLS